MRTTIELSDEHRSALHALAARKGLRGYSKVIQEAIDLYINERFEKRRWDRPTAENEGNVEQKGNREDQKEAGGNQALLENRLIVIDTDVVIDFFGNVAPAAEISE